MFIWLEWEIGCLRFIKFDYRFMSIWFQIVGCRIGINKEVKWMFLVIWKNSFRKAQLCLSNLIVFGKNKCHIIFECAKLGQESN